MKNNLEKWERSKGIIIWLLLTITMVLSIIPEVHAEEDTTLNIHRHDGYSRDNVAENVAKAHFHDSNKVIIVNREKFPDAISATNISQGRYPVLYSHERYVTDKTIELIQSMALDEIYVLGGELSINQSVVNQLKNKIGVKITRVEGRSRYDANVSAVRANFTQKNHVVIASGEVYSDALYGVSFANTIDAPVVLTKTNRLEPSTVELLKELNVSHATIIGGPLTVNTNVENQLSQLGIVHDRIAGRNRYIGSAEVAAVSYPNPKNIIIASGEIFSDALVSAPLAQKLNAPILLVRSNRMENVVENYITTSLLNIENINILGGPLTINHSLLHPILQQVSEEEDNVTTQKVERTVPINHTVEYVWDESIAEGEELVVQEGVNGEGIRIYLQTLLNGEVLDEEILSEEVTVHPIPEIIHVGVTKETDIVDIDFDMELFNQEVLTLVNEERASLNLHPLYYEAETQYGADIRTLDSINVQTLYADHARPDGSPWYTAFNYLDGTSVFISGENIAYNWITYEEYEELAQTVGALEAKLAQTFYTQYANSQGHYENMIRENFKGMTVSTMFANHDNSTQFIRVYNTMIFSNRY